MIHPPRSLSLYQTTAQGIAAANARHALESEPLPAFAIISTELIPHGIPGSGTCKWQVRWNMQDGTTAAFPVTVRE